MPKRQKAKVHTTPKAVKPTTKPVNIKHRQQLENEATNNLTGVKPWELVRKARHLKRITQGKTYDNWRRVHSARSDLTPTASNTLTAPVAKRPIRMGAAQ